MALFGSKKTAEKKEVKPEIRTAPASSLRSFAHIFSSPRITEKASMHESMSVYTLNVSGSANKREIKEAISRIYKVSPRMVRIVPIPAKFKRNMRTGQTGVKKGGRKAYIYLKKGDTLTLR